MSEIPEAQRALRSRNRRMLVSLFVLFFGAMLVAGLLRFSGWRPEGMKNKGELLEPYGDLRSYSPTLQDGGAYRWEDSPRTWRIVVLPRDCDSRRAAAASTEMMADTAWDENLRQRMFPNTTLKGRANLFVFPNLDAANITYNMVRMMTEGVAIGPILMGLDKPAYVLTPAATSRRIINMSAIAAVEAQIRAAISARPA